MQINVDANKIVTGLISAALIGGFTFIWTMNNRLTTIEQSQDLSERVEKLENALLPVLVEYRLQQELEKLELKENEPSSPIIGPTITKEALRNNAEDWAKEQIEQRPVHNAHYRNSE